MMDSVKDVLRQFGLNEYQAKVYIALLKIGPCTASEICKEAKVPQNRVYSVLGELELKGFVVSVPSTPRSFRAIEPKSAIEFVIKEEAVRLSSAKELLEKKLESVATGKSEDDPMEQFWILSGKSGWDKLHRAIMRAEKEVRLINTNFSVFRLLMAKDEDTLHAFNLGISKGVQFRALVPITEKFVSIAKKVSKFADLRHLELEPPRFMIIDDKEAYLVLYPHKSPEDIPTRYASYIIVWTINPDFITELTNLFEWLWKSSEPLEDRLKKM